MAGLQEMLPAGSIIPAYRRTKNLKDMFAPSRFKVNVENNNANGGKSVFFYAFRGQFQLTVIDSGS